MKNPRTKCGNCDKVGHWYVECTAVTGQQLKSALVEKLKSKGKRPATPFVGRLYGKTASFNALVLQLRLLTHLPTRRRHWPLLIKLAEGFVTGFTDHHVEIGAKDKEMTSRDVMTVLGHHVALMIEKNYHVALIAQGAPHRGVPTMTKIKPIVEIGADRCRHTIGTISSSNAAHNRAREAGRRGTMSVVAPRRHATATGEYLTVPVEVNRVW
ncbi:hypothetical protein PInf_021808 [Phytophthora infestans]|nr:hypothetical protein PInf_021808 [Phytophthora infestans]